GLCPRARRPLEHVPVAGPRATGAQRVRLLVEAQRRVLGRAGSGPENVDSPKFRGPGVVARSANAREPRIVAAGQSGRAGPPAPGSGPQNVDSPKFRGPGPG